MMRKIYVFVFFLVAMAPLCVRAQESVAQSEPEPPLISAPDFSTELRRLRADAEQSVALLDDLRGRRDRARGETRVALEKELDAVYDHIDRLRRELAEISVRSGSVETQRRLELERSQQRMLAQGHGQMHRVVAEQQQRQREEQLRQRQMQEQRRLAAMHR